MVCAHTPKAVQITTLRNFRPCSAELQGEGEGRAPDPFQTTCFLKGFGGVFRFSIQAWEGHVVLFCVVAPWLMSSMQFAHREICPAVDCYLHGHERFHKLWLSIRLWGRVLSVCKMTHDCSHEIQSSKSCCSMNTRAENVQPYVCAWH